jgi:phosphonopyruvate decarboxylase
MDIATFVVSKDTAEAELEAKMAEFRELWKIGKQTALVIRKGALEFDGKVKYSNENTMVREKIIEHITDVSGEDIVVSTTGKASRELFEIRERRGQTHGSDFLTVGSMGHSSSIALAIAKEKPDRKIWIIDGDGALLMHMGAMALLGVNAPRNVVHVVINNGAHETVGGLPTVAEKIDLCKIADGCGYPSVISVNSFDAFDKALKDAREADRLSFIEVKCSIGARDDLGRPTTTAKENKENFMRYLSLH